MKVPSWAVVQELESGEWCFRSADWLIMGEGYETRVEAIKGAWDHHGRVMAGSKETNPVIAALEEELAKTRKELVKTFLDLLRVEDPTTPLPSMVELSRQKWGDKAVDLMFPEGEPVFEEDEED